MARTKVCGVAEPPCIKTLLPDFMILTASSAVIKFGIFMWLFLLTLISDYSIIYDKKLNKIPAAMADPMTPETLGAMACINK